MSVAILCGGKGTRLAPLTDTLPKSLVDVNGEPFLVRQLRLLKSHGYTRFVLLTGHFGPQIMRAIGDGQQFGVYVTYSDDGPAPIGTDAAILKALPLLGKEFFVLYGDSYLNCDYRDLEARLREYVFLDAVLTTYEGVDYGIRAYRQFPPQTWMDVPMPHRWEDIGSHKGLERVRAITR